jgi:TonB family protein
MIRAGRYLCEDDGPYRVRLSVSAALAITLHVTLLSVLPPSWWRMDQPEHTGWKGPERPAPVLEPPRRAPKRPESARPRMQLRGVLRVVELEILPQEPAARRRQPRRSSPRPRGQEARSSRPAKSPPAGPMPETVIELGEDLVPRPSITPIVTTERFAILRMVAPEYPEPSLRNGVEGRLRAKVRVDTAGVVVGIEILESEVDAFCEAAVKEALWQWRFRPYRRNGHKIPFTVLVPFRFELVE